MIHQLVEVYVGRSGFALPVVVVVAKVVGYVPKNVTNTIRNLVLTVPHMVKGQCHATAAAVISGISQVQIIIAMFNTTGVGAGELKLAVSLIGKAGFDVGNIVFLLDGHSLVAQVTVVIAAIVELQRITTAGRTGIHDQISRAHINNSVRIQFVALDRLRRMGDLHRRQHRQNHAHRQHKGSHSLPVFHIYLLLEKSTHSRRQFFCRENAAVITLFFISAACLPPYNGVSDIETHSNTILS